MTRAVLILERGVLRRGLVRRGGETFLTEVPLRRLSSSESGTTAA